MGSWATIGSPNDTLVIENNDAILSPTYRVRLAAAKGECDSAGAVELISASWNRKV